MTTPVGTRTFPPFQGNGGVARAAAPLFTLKGEEIDLFIHLTGVRPGSVLETGNTFALVGASRSDVACKGGLHRYRARTEINGPSAGRPMKLATTMNRRTISLWISRGGTSLIYE